MQNLGRNRLGCGLRDYVIDIGPVEHFFLQQGFRQFLQTGHIFREQPLRPFIVFHHKPFDFLVDLHGNLLAEVALAPELSAQKHLFVVFAKGQGAHLFAHPPFTHHFPREIRRPLAYISQISRPKASTCFQSVNSATALGSVGPLVIHMMNRIICRSQKSYS